MSRAGTEKQQPLCIYMDALRRCVPSRRWPYRRSCHLFTEPGRLDDLHAFAVSIGLKREWFQRHRKLPHYDLNASRYTVAMRQGAILVKDKVVVNFMEDWRLARRVCGWKCTPCGWVALTDTPEHSPESIKRALIPHPLNEMELFMVCPKCLATNQFEDAYETVPDPYAETP